MEISEERLDELICLHGQAMEKFPGMSEGQIVFADTVTALGELRERRKADRWIPVSERVPEVERENRYFGVSAGFDAQPFVPVIFALGKEVCAGRFFCAFGRRKDAWFSLQGRKYETREVTHWRPLPVPSEVSNG